MSTIAIRRRPLAGFAAALIAGAVAFSAPAAMADDGAAAYHRVSKEVGPALVAVKYILKVDASGEMADQLAQNGNTEQEMELTALMIEAGGLVLCSNSELVGEAGYYARYQPELGLRVTPTDVKVLIGDDTEGIAAKVVARDVDLDLAWLRIDKPGDRKFDFVDLSRSTPPETGQRLFTVARLGKFFDRALVISEGRVAGTTSKPRDLIVPSGIESRRGMPVFSEQGELVGVSVFQLPAPEDMEAGGNQSQFAGANRMILPAAEVLKATERAKEVEASGQSPDGEPAGEPAVDPGADPAPVEPK